MLTERQKYLLNILHRRPKKLTLERLHWIVYVAVRRSSVDTGFNVVVMSGRPVVKELDWEVSDLVLQGLLQESREQDTLWYQLDTTRRHEYMTSHQMAGDFLNNSNSLISVEDVRLQSAREKIRAWWQDLWNRLLP